MKNEFVIEKVSNYLLKILSDDAYINSFYNNNVPKISIYNYIERLLIYTHCEKSILIIAIL